MLGPEGHVYDPLPTSTSIRVLILPPGQPEDDIFCYLYPCDLDLSYTIDPSVPRPFKWLSVAKVPGLNSEDETKDFTISLDSYVEFDSEENAASRQNQQDRKSHIGEPYEPSIKSASTMGRQFGTDSTQSDAAKEQPDEEPDEWEWYLKQIRRHGDPDTEVYRHPFQRYMALSYVWGSVENAASITINGGTKFWVTRSLFDALKCLRQPKTALTLWIDAICINQNDKEEKEVQIGLMRRVYRQAQKVIAYVPQTQEDTENFKTLLGKILHADKQCRAAIDSGARPEQQAYAEYSKSNEQAESESKRSPKHPAGDSDGLPRVSYEIRPLEPTGTHIEDHDIPAEDDPVWVAWRRFFASPYFRRIWILQEFALARDIFFHFGQGQVHVDLILLVVHSVKYRSNMANAQYLGRGENADLTRAAMLGWMGLEKMIYERIFTQHDLYGSDKSLDQKLIQKLEKAMQFDATDPRDKVYALLGLALDAEQFQDLVSYQPSDTYPEIYRRFAKALIEKGHFVKILQMACMTPINPQLPSWVPDWSTPTESPLTATVPLDKEFHAGGNENPVNIQYSQQNPNQLILSGHVFSTIAFKTTPFVPHSSVHHTSVKELGTYLDQEPATFFLDIFHVLTMQLRPLDSVDSDDPARDEYGNDMRLFGTLIVRVLDYLEIENHAEQKVVFGPMPEEDREFYRKVAGNTTMKSFCVTDTEKRIGLVPERAQVDDKLATFEGVPVPVVLREVIENATEIGKAYRVIGDAYITGAMQGEVGHNCETAGKQIILI